MKLALEMDTLRVDSFETVAKEAQLAAAGGADWSFPRECTTKFQGCP
jgi:hypothetical protein